MSYFSFFCLVWVSSQLSFTLTGTSTRAPGDENAETNDPSLSLSPLCLKWGFVNSRSGKSSLEAWESRLWVLMWSSKSYEFVNGDLQCRHWYLNEWLLTWLSNSCCSPNSRSQCSHRYLGSWLIFPISRLRKERSLARWCADLSSLWDCKMAGLRGWSSKRPVGNLFPSNLIQATFAASSLACSIESKLYHLCTGIFSS
ncbi:hypothetical protein ASPWEDRAFT_670084 [Aspergillus wentii DTO 134E9]|uniref:Secreted protein n=1 Tax=Aspergillus wentii DTO 134E9 TaxID=1073089 RepID=A0A1L9RCB9_ASPWE|nr:uncharacterized protein ASPWEDRAFT_670084 [Aspergillus wentii DTO 134E9]OJJ32561.1 hypothetical protein ASPWEDRAFT_670084 [Aspergillus wentii DTO 134E9]